MKKWMIFLMILMCVFVMICSHSLAEIMTVTDMTGREIQVETPVTRIVALTAADCEIICVLGYEDALVGRGEYCDYPETVLEKPSVQSGVNTNIEEIIALQPQVVVMSTMAQTTEQADALAAAGIETIIDDAQDIEGVYTSIRILGTLLGCTDKAEEIVTQMQSAFETIREQSTSSEKTVYFEVSPLQWGLWTAGTGTFMNELAELCGVKNAFADVEGWAQISEEQVIERNPDYIVTITMYYGEGPTPVEEIVSRSGWSEVKAIQDGHILNADSNEISRPGPRLMEAAKTLFDFFNDADSGKSNESIEDAVLRPAA